MTLQLDIVDEDLVVVLNLNAVGQGSSTGFEVRSWDMGQVDPETEFISNPAFPGAIQTVTHHGPVDMELSLQAVGSSFDNIQEIVGVLGGHLANGGLMRYKFDGQTNYRYIEYFGSQLPWLIRGDNDVTQKYIVERFQDLTGFPLVIRRQPYVWEGTYTALDAQDVRNDNIGSSMTQLVSVGGDLPALARVTVRVESANSKACEVKIGRKSTGDLTEYQDNYVQYAVSPLTTIGTAWRKMHKQVFSPTTSSALEGTYRVFVNLKLEDFDTYKFQLRWGTINIDPAGNVNDEVTIDSIDAPAAMVVGADIDLGTVRFDRTGSALVLEIWARAENGSEVDFTDAWLLPVEEESVYLFSPGFRWGRFSRVGHNGNELVRGGGAVLNDDDRVILSDVGEFCQTTATTLPVGIHLVSFHGTVINFAKTRTEIGRLLVTIGGGGDDVRSLKLTSRRKHTRVHYDNDNPRQVSFEVEDTGTEYQFRVEQTVNNDDRRHIKVDKLVHSYVPTVEDGRAFILDGIERVAYISNDTGARYFPAHAKGPFMTVPPGDSVWVFRISDLSPRAVYRTADVRGPLAEVHPLRTAQVTIEVRERFIV